MCNSSSLSTVKQRKNIPVWSKHVLSLPVTPTYALPKIARLSCWQPTCLACKQPKNILTRHIDIICGYLLIIASRRPLLATTTCLLNVNATRTSYILKHDHRIHNLTRARALRGNSRENKTTKKVFRDSNTLIKQSGDELYKYSTTYSLKCFAATFKTFWRWNKTSQIMVLLRSLKLEEITTGRPM